MIIGHRGARGLWPENSLSGFIATAQLGIDGVELDVHLTAANEVVVIHDPTLDRTTVGTGDVALLTPRVRLTTPLRGTDSESIPLLADTLDIFRGTAMEVQVELKPTAAAGRYEGLAERVVAVIRDLGMHDQCVLASFLPEALEEVLALDPNCRTLASISSNSATRLGGLDVAIERFHSIAGLLAVEQSLLESVLDVVLTRRRREDLCVWVPNTESEIVTWMSRGLSRLTTDRPDLALRVREASRF